MTPQEIFDHVSRHLLKQGKAAMMDDHCCFRNPEGLRCAVGCLIPEDRYVPELENGSLGTIVEHLIALQEGHEDEPDFDGYDEALMETIAESVGLPPEEVPWGVLCALQGIHDGIAPGQWEVHLDRLALKHGFHPVLE
jgi:hypothetical protein